MELAAALPAVAGWGMWAYVALFAVAVFESAPILGTAVPGLSVVIVAGFAASQGIFGGVPLFWAIAIGAFLGDIGGYYLGRWGRCAFSPSATILNDRHLARGRAFLDRHGGKSVFFGRFTGVLRATVPFVAGAASMPVGKFLFWNAASAVLWTAAWLAVGALVGGAAATAWGALAPLFR